MVVVMTFTKAVTMTMITIITIIASVLSFVGSHFDNVEDLKRVRSVP